ncbi:MAG: outer membrane protein [Paracoccus sp. (in: a-proteobacteria)]
MKFAIAAIAATLTAGSALAGGYTAPVTETPVVAPVAPVAMNNDVDWTGFYAGVQYGQGNAEADGVDGSPDTDFDAYGVHGGYNYDFGKYVLGGELDYNKLDFDDLDDKGDLWRLRGRAGYEFGKFMPYVTLGVAHLSADQDDFDVSDTAVTYGIGAEYMVTDKFTVGAEYTKQDFDDVSDDINDLDIDSDMVQVRASFRF